jgi:predicted nucleic acid-binding protein
MRRWQCWRRPWRFARRAANKAEAAAHLKNEFGLGLADAFAGALAKEKKAELYTTDTEFKALEEELKIVWIEG